MKLPYANFAARVVFCSSLLLPAADLLAQRGGHGPNPSDHGSGPGPGHMNYGNKHAGNFYGVENLAYYGDWNSNRVFIINVDEMSLLKTVDSTGDSIDGSYEPYGVDQQDGSTAYALTRKTESLTVIENYYFENIGEILLDHKPRSTNFNPHTGLSLVSGADKVMSTVIHVNSDRVKGVYGADIETEPDDFGGSLATGHPLWISDYRFLMLDRADRQIELWSRTLGLLSVIDTPTSVHHVFKSPLDFHQDIFYAVVEGNQDELVSPSILRFRIHRGRYLRITGEAVLENYSPGTLNPANMGSHHAAFHPDGVHIYVGSAEGHVFVVDKNSMKVEAMIDAGLGAGHITFVPLHERAFVTNHYDTFMTVIDTANHSFFANIEVAEEPEPAEEGNRLQAHTSSVSADQEYFYSAASNDGVFFEIQVDPLGKTRSLNLNSFPQEGVYPLMGSFVWGDEADDGGM